MYEMTTFNKGRKVEVLNRKELPSCSWQCAEIVSGNGHSYLVRFENDPWNLSYCSQRISRKFIRPLPPLVECPRSWIHGDIVEFYDNNSWKLAQVVGALGWDYFSILILGTSRILEVRSTNLRVRQCWLRDTWIVMQKEFRRSNTRTVKGDPGLSDRMRKRSQLWSGTAGGDCDSLIRRKMIAFENERGDQLAFENAKETLDSVVLPGAVHERYAHDSVSCNARSSKIGSHREKPNAEFAVASKELGTAFSESICSSVGSCSISHYPHLPMVHEVFSSSNSSHGPDEEDDDDDDDEEEEDVSSGPQ